MAEKVEWLNKLRNVIGSKGGVVKGDSSASMRQSLSDGSLVSSCISFFLVEFCWYIYEDFSYYTEHDNGTGKIEKRKTQDLCDPAFGPH